MAAYFNLILDTTVPQGASVSINSGAAYATTTSVTLGLATSDSPTTGYEMKVWGDISGGPATEGAATWEAFSTSKAITLSSGDATKTLNAKIRDDVYNETAVLSDTIILDTTLPVVTVGTPSVSKISKVAGKRTATCTWQVDTAYAEFQARVVPATGSLVNAGTLIPTTNGSSDTSGSAGGYAATTNRTLTIDGADLEAASAGDGTKIIKIFARDNSGNWSV